MADQRSPNSSVPPSQSPRSSDTPGQDSPPAVVDPVRESADLEKAAGLDRIRALSHLLDNAIPVPGTDYSFGLDPIIGLLPAGGDVVGTVLSAYIVLEAARFRLSVATVTRMVFNIILEMIVGTVPVIGDLFDVGWKANVKNLRLLESHLEHPTESRAADWKFFVALVVVLGGMILLQILWYILVFRALVSLFSG